MSDEGRNAEILEAIIDDGTYTEEAQSRNEEILLSILNDTEYDKPPQSKIEELMLEVKKKIEEGGGGGGGQFDELEFVEKENIKSTEKAVIE